MSNAVCVHSIGDPVRSSRLIFLLPLLFIITKTMPAAWLRDVPVQVRQPDGSTLPCFASGDEFNNWLHDRNGFTIIQDPSTGWYLYAERRGELLAPTSHRPGTADPAAAGLTPGAYLTESAALANRTRWPEYIPTARALAPRTGVLNNIVIFIRFSDDTEFPDAQSVYTSRFNTNTPGANSVYNYFREISYGRLEIQTWFLPANTGTAVLSYQDTQPRATFMPYSASNPSGYTSANGYTRERELLTRAVQAVASQLPGTVEVDGDGDSYVDNVCFIIRGTPTAWATLLWPHMSAMGSNAPLLNGKKVRAYNFQIESMADVHVFCHEMIHTLGAPDLYRYASPDAVAPVGPWDVMASTPNPPQHTGAYMRFRYLTWINAIPRITASGRYSLRPVSEEFNNCYRIDSPNPGEFFLLEYRKRTSVFENSIPTEGLLVYRIDTLVSGNADGPPDGVYVYRPGGFPAGSLPANGTLNAAAFRAPTRTAINDTTDPACLLTSGAPGGLAISEIGAPGDSLAFTVTIGDNTPAWSRVPLPTSMSFSGIAFGAGAAGWLAGTTMFYRSTDGGTSWNSLPSSAMSSGNGISAVDSLRCWGIGKTSVFRTTDGGASWATTFLSVPAGGRLYAIAMQSPARGWIAGSGGTLYQTTNGGETWMLIPTGSSRALRTVHFQTDRRGWAAGEGGTLAGTTDGGVNWTVWTFSDTLSFHGIAFADSLNGFLVGELGRVYRTTNGGAQWMPRGVPTRAHLNAVMFEGPDSGWIVGDQGTIFRTTDGGVTWTGTTSGTLQNLKAIAAPDARTRWVAGDNGTLLRHGDGPVSSVPGVDDPAPLIFHLAQNYPNPFNPGTTITYALSAGAGSASSGGPSHVTLSVYDLLGRLVRVLVDEPQLPGTHVARFDATGLASGVYLYRLSVEGRSEARSMLFIR